MRGDMLRLDGSSEDIFIYLDKSFKDKNGDYVFTKYDFIFDDELVHRETVVIGNITIKEVANRSTNKALLEYINKNLAEHLI